MEKEHGSKMIEAIAFTTVLLVFVGPLVVLCVTVNHDRKGK